MALVQSIASSPFSGSGSLTLTNTAGNTLVFYYMGTIGAFSNTVADTNTNPNWRLGFKSNQGFGNDIEIWYCENIAGGSNTVNGSGIGSNVNCYLEEWSAVKTSADPILDANGTNGSSSPLQVSLNPSVAALILAGWYNGPTDDYTGLTSGLTLGYHETVGNYMAVASNPSASSGAQNVGFTTGGDGSNVMAAIALELAPSGVTVTPNTGVSTSLGFAPSVSVSNNINIATGLGSSVSNGFAPSVSVSNNIRIETNVGSSNSLGFAPSIIRPILVRTSLGQSQSQGFAPNVSTSNTIAINTGVNVSQGYAPLVSVSNNVSISTNLGQSNSLGFAPIVSVSQNILIQTGVCLSVSRGFAPIVTGTRVDSVIQQNSNGTSIIKANPALNSSVITRNSNNGSVIEP